MCGIAGIISKNNSVIPINWIEGMIGAVKHRGPNAQKYKMFETVALGHTRLSILDLSDAGLQPMSYLDKYHIIFNGEVYNFIEIRNELRKKGYLFSSNTDTEVILAAYDAWGTQCVTKFNGMWAFSILDREKNIVFCSRDRFGIKPLYFYDSSEYFFWGSEIKQLLPHLNSIKANRTALFEYLSFGLVNNSNNTFFDKIRKLPQSSSLVYDLKSKTFKIDKYYNLEVKNYGITNLSEGISKFEELFIDSIKLRLRSDVKVGTCLSGGIDSSLIAAVSAKLYHNENKFIGIHARSEDKSKDESYFAHEVAKAHDIDLQVITPTYIDFINSAEKVIEIQEEPFGGPSIIMQYFVMKAAQNNGCIVLLDGQGADEILLGYERYYTTFLRSVSFTNKLSAVRSISRHSKLSVKDLFYYYLYFSNYQLRKIALTKKVGKSFANAAFRYIDRTALKEMIDSYVSIKDLQLSEISKVQLPGLLNYEDKNSMHHSIETRLPFLDYRLVEYCLSLPNSYKINGGWTKYLLRKYASEFLHSEIVWRKVKFGFEAPMDQWFSDRRMLLSSIKENGLTNHLVSEFNPDFKDNWVLWRFYNLSQWARVFKVNDYQ